MADGPQAQDGPADGRSTPDGVRTTGAALESHYRFVLWLVPTLERFPRSQKFLLGDRIQATAMDVLERLIEATYTRRRAGHLASANLGLEKLRWRQGTVSGQQDPWRRPFKRETPPGNPCQDPRGQRMDSYVVLR